MSLIGSSFFGGQFRKPRDEEERRQMELMEEGRLKRLNSMRELNNEQIIHEAFESWWNKAQGI